MSFTGTVKEILRLAAGPLTPQQIQEEIKRNYPQYFGTHSHHRNVDNGHYSDLDHALLAQIYSLVRTNRFFNCDKSTKPYLVSLADNNQRQPRRPRTNSVRVRRNDPVNIPARQTNTNEDDLVRDQDRYYQQSLSVLEDFGGPSVYFHIQAIKEQEKDFLSDRHIEMIYATLSSWGMHKMGDTKTKMVKFDEFKHSILSKKNLLQEFVSLRMELCNEDQYQQHLDRLRDIYFALKVSISQATIVAHSKTLAHLLPNLIPPIDRQYTVRFFTQDGQSFYDSNGRIRGVANLPSGIKAQFQSFKDYCSRIKKLLDCCDYRKFIIDKDTFNTSYPKIMDNLIMAYVKSFDPNPR